MLYHKYRQRRLDDCCLRRCGCPGAPWSRESTSNFAAALRPGGEMPSPGTPCGEHSLRRQAALTAPSGLRRTHRRNGTGVHSECVRIAAFWSAIWEDRGIRLDTGAKGPAESGAATSVRCVCRWLDARSASGVVRHPLLLAWWLVRWRSRSGALAHSDHVGRLMAVPHVPYRFSPEADA